MWDAGTEVAVAGQAFGGALQLVNQAAREDAMDRRIVSGGRQFVQGWARRTAAGVTALRIGLETQTEARGAAVVTYYAIPLPAVGTWAAFSAWVTTPAGHVWARPYLQAVGGTGEFAEIYIGPAQPGATAGADWTEVTDSAGTRPANNATVGAVFGTNLLENSGGATATLENFRTNLGISAGFTGQGALATKSAVNLASTEVTNKSLANLDSSANTKLGGIAAGATVGAIFGTNLLETSGGASATLANFKTALGVAAGFTGQGLLATKNAVAYGTSDVSGFGALAGRAKVSLNDGFVFRENGTTALTDAVAVTSLGVASAVAGQSAWATTAIPTNAYEALPPGCAVGAMGDVRFTKNQNNAGGANDGEIRVQGTTLYVPNRGKVTISQAVLWCPLESSTANGTGRFYLVLGTQNESVRFPGWNSPAPGPIFLARYDWTSGQWSGVDNSGVLYPFTFAEDDAILATVYRASTASSGIDSLQSFVSEWRIGMPTDYADQTAANVAGGFTGQGPLATSVLTEAQVQGRWLGDYSGDSAANAAGLQAGDVYLDTSVFPNRVRAKKPGGTIQTVSLAPGTVSNTGTGTSSGSTWVVAARISLTNLQAGSLIMASGELYALPSNGTSLANATGFQGRAKLYEATPGQTDFSTIDASRAIGDEWTFIALNDGSNFVMSDFFSSYDAPSLRRLKFTPATDIVLLIKRESGTNNVTNLGAKIRPTVFGV